MNQYELGQHAGKVIVKVLTELDQPITMGTVMREIENNWLPYFTEEPTGEINNGKNS